jgi:hypothetical protein
MRRARDTSTKGTASASGMWIGTPSGAVIECANQCTSEARTKCARWREGVSLRLVMDTTDDYEIKVSKR